MQADLKGEPKADDTGKLWTPGAVDFFRIVNEQLQVASLNLHVLIIFAI